MGTQTLFYVLTLPTYGVNNTGVMFTQSHFYWQNSNIVFFSHQLWKPKLHQGDDKDKDTFTVLKDQYASS